MIEERGSQIVKALAAKIRRERRGCAGAILGMCPMADEDASGAAETEVQKESESKSKSKSEPGLLRALVSPSDGAATGDVLVVSSSSAASMPELADGRPMPSGTDTIQVMPRDSVILPDICLSVGSSSVIRSMLPITAKLAAVVIADLAEEEEARREASTVHRASALPSSAVLDSIAGSSSV